MTWTSKEGNNLSISSVHVLHHNTELQITESQVACAHPHTGEAANQSHLSPIKPFSMAKRFVKLKSWFPG